METTVRHTLSKEERLYRKRGFEQLLSQGESFVSYPLRVVYVFREREEGEFPARVAVSVSKKRFKRAVKRNRVKRLVKEAYRLNKPEFYAILPDKKTVDILFIYLEGSLVEYGKIEKAIAGVIKKIRNYMEKRAGLDTAPAD